ncbi:hypothetical protein PR202_gb08030 [Eleusine coracana subsp. coracana]|uniref:Uncharacterized protein n=1 Tax=Eleusine coracana subsp. coracana TaxID=191504 RepID=A0AAV5EDB5_ELECO|nr:hypothetical protein QOZ80_2BG0180280 [Eleusine coracana subsp. coracana]GJN20630.1 hypothetical protein PR202_gb08030 [Eleusine coracana subsp. coracana]
MSLLACLRGAKKGSASSVVVDSARGRHDLRIDGLSFAVGALAPIGQSVASSAFSVGGHRWRIKCYPNGNRADSAGHVSVYLALDEEPAAGEEVTAVFEFALLAERRAAFFLKKSKEVQSRPPLRHSFTSQQRNFGYRTFAKRDALVKLPGADKGDSFVVRCQIVVINGFRTEDEEDGAPKSGANFVTVPPPDLHRHLGHLLDTKKGADVVFHVSGKTFAAHRFVLAARSPVFDAELFSGMKETDAAGVIRIADMEPGVFKALLRFVYSDSLPEMKKGEEDAMCQHLLVAADRYGIERLKLMCEENLCNYITVHTAAIILTLAEQHNCSGLKRACLDFLKAPANLRAVVASDGFEHLSTSCPSIKKDLLDALAS